MLQYGDLSLKDIADYWSGAMLMFERNGSFVPCVIEEMKGESNYPIVLHSAIDGKRLIALRLNTFVQKVLVHHPTMGYGDYKGIPLYLSPRAGRERRKGVDTGNLEALCPIDWSRSVKARMEEITKMARSSKGDLSSAVIQEYKNLQQLVQNVTRPRMRSMQHIPGRIRIRDKSILANVMVQCVNNEYPTLQAALRKMQNDTKRHGVSLSLDFAIIRCKDMANDSLCLYHRMSPVGSINLYSGDVTFNPELSSEGIACIKTAFNRVGGASC
mgnify:FL=1